jgi:hypothetical protein
LIKRESTACTLQSDQITNREIDRSTFNTGAS